MKYLISLIIFSLLFFLFYIKQDKPPIKIDKTPKVALSKSKEIYTYPKEQYSAGGLAKLRFTNKPELFHNGKKVNVFVQKQKNDWLMLIPFSLFKDTEHLRFTSNTSSLYQVHLFNLKKENYTKQYIKVGRRKSSKTPKKSIKRIQEDYFLKKETYARRSKIYINSLQMIKPLDSALRHDFGRKRFFNGVAKNPHGGIDLSGKKGDQIKAALSGEIIILGNLFYNGHMIIIDHGQGLLTAYSHLSKFLKKDGDWVRQGDVIGEVGSTGRATGPHLHWSVYLGGEPINPDLFLDLGKAPTLKIR